ncbi:MAG: zinc-binding alcohol dehydrogenase family protein [Acidobacteriota bacterium]|nr:zinc-binding alcohol dehydrogenase family protein [Acidobacteriota bacterium]
MKALRIEAPGRVGVVEVPDLRTARPGEVLLRVDMVGMCGTDLSTFRGGNAMVRFPRILGHEVSATVVQGGGDLAAGTRVAVSPYTSCGRCSSCLRNRSNACQFNETLGVQRDGAMTEYLSMPRDRLYPAALGRNALCLVEPLTVGMHAVSRGRVASRDVVAVFGCGGVGLGAIAGAAFRGAETIAIDIDDRKLAVARKAGARHIIRSDVDNLHTRLQEITGGRGPDVVIEAIGLPHTFVAAVEEVAFTGRVVYIGYAKEPVSYVTRLFVQKELDILGSRNAMPEDFREVIRLLEFGSFPLDEAISCVVPLSQAADMLAQWSASPELYTKILVEI